jgi:hypothetical protein
MPERYSPINDFDHNAVGDALKTQAAATQDVAHGNGQALSVWKRQGTA